MENTVEIVARFWQWYQSASRQERGPYEDANDFGRPAQLDATAWTVLNPAATGESFWFAYPSALSEVPHREQMLRADTEAVLRQFMAGFQRNASAWGRAGQTEADSAE